MDKLIKVENEEDGEVDCPDIMNSCCPITEEEVATEVKGLNILKVAGPTDVVSEIMMASGGLGTRWMTDGTYTFEFLV